ncbi:hypothetical protein ASPWEDRAFT_176257 [Aspergillus wentii DTO 134E9]|uniref:Uncharacterized protein n=1 Tax=Aspergillus wentii DTO 134E9 TaxID=1073089 RepID=A0A1L9R8E1_ASPWE|nr:uncharacterized protein ASPWEDRAFT_176257 [Aspergillus wentii DTO 134E9]OJJ31158.1 hypothetical protein ASPWEDRAFT_176257 [Aspergillus wentii DTO 134E9]
MSLENPLPSVHTKTTPGPAPNGLGTGIFASADIGSGQDVLNVQSPFVAVLDTPRLEDTCSGCFGKRHLEVPVDLKACTGCQVTKYCDRTCQAKDWKFAHSLECPIYQKLKPRILPNNARAILRMVLRSGRRKYAAQELDLFVRLETHVREILDQNMKQWERIALSAKAVKAYSGTEMSEQALSAFGAKLDMNAFNLTNAQYDRIGLYLHPYAALINHGCDYNSVAGFDGDELFVKAIRPIKKGEQIFISYIDATNPLEYRRGELSERYYFNCQCSKCEKGTDTMEDRFLPTAPSDCSTLDASHRKTLELMESASDPDTEPLKAVNMLESAMQGLRQTGSWPIARQPYVSLRDELITSLLSAGRFKSAFIHAAIRCILIDPVIYSHDAHPIRHLHGWALAKLAIHLSQGMEANTDDPYALEAHGLNFNFIIWFILSKLVSQESESCTVPSFKRLVRSAFNDVHKEFTANGLDPMDMIDNIRKEWDKLERIVRESDSIL